MITFSGKTVSIGGKSFEIEHPIADAFELQGRIIVLFNPDAYSEEFGQFPNLIALRPTEERLWTAELPTTPSGDRYYKVTSQRPLVVYSIYSFECEIDPATGRIAARHFFQMSITPNVIRSIWLLLNLTNSYKTRRMINGYPKRFGRNRVSSNPIKRF